MLHPGSNKLNRHPTGARPGDGPVGYLTGYNGAALNSRWECSLSVVLRGTDAANLVAQGTRRLPHASEAHGSANRSGRDSNGILFRPGKVDYVISVRVWVGFEPKLGSKKNLAKNSKAVFLLRFIS